jgi:hypothetical protein
VVFLLLSFNVSIVELGKQAHARQDLQVEVLI